MPSALDTFRAQREAADQLHARLREIGDLVELVRREVDALSHNAEFRTVLQMEMRWLEEARRSVSEVRAWREQELRRFWPGVLRRWALALVFALASAAGAGLGYAWITHPYVAELNELRLRSEFERAVEQRVLTMTPAERRQFDSLMKWTPAARR